MARSYTHDTFETYPLKWFPVYLLLICLKNNSMPEGQTA